ncbi:type II toxin-antitoxin system PemK/MazF family toxin [Devriesea agamarum]|uniref:type II toxin-antitoxin system PemK/MazF family toxin n=1 Tax=Devriesea agamarum TaxID=472569 RepID=UPI00071D81A2|nr:type II toxin-antitoxin system PemK/MazF family toxin [Devriesea agamarum]
MALFSRLAGIVRSLAQSPQVRRAARDLAKEAGRQLSSPPRPVESHDRARHTSTAKGSPAQASGAQLADRPSQPPLHLSYSPHPDDKADPGEVVWGWVPFEEMDGRGKDRPVLVIALEDDVLVALMLTSRDRGDGVHTDHHGQHWIDIGIGSWDPQRRPSEVRLDRLIRLAPGSVRRGGGRIDHSTFSKVADATRRVHGWRPS